MEMAINPFVLFRNFETRNPVVLVLHQDARDLTRFTTALIGMYTH